MLFCCLLFDQRADGAELIEDLGDVGLRRGAVHLVLREHRVGYGGGGEGNAIPAAFPNAIGSSTLTQVGQQLRYYQNK